MSISKQEAKDFRDQVSAWMKENKPADPGVLAFLLGSGACVASLVMRLCRSEA